MEVLRPILNYVRARPALGRLALRAIPDLHWTLHIDPIGPFVVRMRRNRGYWLRPAFIEGLTQGCFARFVRPGDVVYDVGANIGLYVRLLAALGAARVVAFEPMTENRELLLTNIRVGGIQDTVTVLPCALSDHDGQEDLQLDQIMSGSAALSSVTGGLPSQGHQRYRVRGEVERVAVRRLDTIAPEANLPAPRLVKIDVEGGARLVLDGAREFLARHRPVLVIECHGVAEAAAVFAALSELGYTCAGYGFRRPHRILTGEYMRTVTGKYDVEHIVAAFDPAELEQPVETVDHKKLAAVVRANSGRPA